MAQVDMEKRARLVSGLINKTVEGRIQWREGVREGAFVTDFTRSSITLEKHKFAYTGEECHEEWHSIEVSNEKGHIIDRFDLEEVLVYISERSLRSRLFIPQVLEEGDSVDALAESFFGGVRFSAMNGDDVYDGVLQELAS
jgi:hypothetical protein